LSSNNDARFIKFIAGLVIVGAIFGGAFKNSTTETEPAKPANPCKADWTQCVDNADMANNNSDYSRAHYDCKDAATKLAKYGTPEWPWLVSFGAFLKGNDYATKGVAVMIENDARFQNGFGAMAHVKVRCEYDLRAKKVIDIIITEK
jgi:hypothetical protein